jgi:hypothetical protein
MEDDRAGGSRPAGAGTKQVTMTTIAELTCCDGFAVEGRDGVLGWVEETWLDSDDQPGALAVRTCDGRRTLLVADAVAAVDVDAQEVILVPGAELLELDAPRITASDGQVAATWISTGAPALPAVAGSLPAAPVFLASRTATAQRERPPWRVAAYGLTGLATTIAAFIGLLYLVAYLVTGHPY